MSISSLSSSTALAVDLSQYTPLLKRQIIQINLRPFGCCPQFTHPITSKTLPPITPVEYKAISFSYRKYIDSITGKNTLPPMDMVVQREIARLCERICSYEINPYKVLRAHLIQNFLSCHEFFKTAKDGLFEVAAFTDGTAVPLTLPEIILDRFYILSSVFESLDHYLISNEPCENNYKLCKESVEKILTDFKELIDNAPKGFSETTISRIRKDIIEKLALLDACLNDKEGLFLLLIGQIEENNPIFDKTTLELFLNSYDKESDCYHHDLINRLNFVEVQLRDLNLWPDLKKFFIQNFTPIIKNLTEIEEYRKKHANDLRLALNKLEGTYIQRNTAIANLEECVRNFVVQRGIIKSSQSKLVNAYTDYFIALNQLIDFFHSDELTIRCKKIKGGDKLEKFLTESRQGTISANKKFINTVSQSFTSLMQVLQYTNVLDSIIETEQLLLDRYKEIKVLYPTENSGIQFLELVILNCRERLSVLECSLEIKRFILSCNTKVFTFYTASKLSDENNKEDYINECRKFIAECRDKIIEWKHIGTISPIIAEVIIKEFWFLMNIVSSKSKKYLELSCGYKSNIVFEDIKIFKSIVLQNLEYSVIDQLSALLPEILGQIETLSWPSSVKNLIAGLERLFLKIQSRSLAWQEEVSVIRSCKDPSQVIIRYAKLVDIIDEEFFYSNCVDYIEELDELNGPQWGNFLKLLNSYALATVEYGLFDRSRNRSIQEAADYLKEEQRAAAAAPLIACEVINDDEIDTATDSVESPICLLEPAIPISIDRAFNALKAILVDLRNTKICDSVEIKNISLMHEALSNILEGYLPSIREVFFKAECPIKRYGKITVSELLTKLALCIEQAQKYACASRGLSFDLPSHDLEGHQTALNMKLTPQDWDLISSLNGFSHSRRLSSNYLISPQGLALLKETRQEVFINLTNQAIQLTAYLLTGKNLSSIDETPESISQSRLELDLEAETCVMLAREVRALLTERQKRSIVRSSKSDRCIYTATNTIKRATWALESLLGQPLNLDHSVIFTNALFLNAALGIEQLLITGIAKFEDGVLLREKVQDRELRYCHNTEILLRSLKKCYALDFTQDEEEIASSFQSVIGHLTRYVSHCKNEKIYRLLEELRFMSDVREHMLTDGFLTTSQHERFARDFGSSLQVLEEKMIQIIKGDVLVLVQRALQFCQSLIQKMS